MIFEVNMSELYIIYLSLIYNIEAIVDCDCDYSSYMFNINLSESTGKQYIYGISSIALVENLLDISKT